MEIHLNAELYLQIEIVGIDQGSLRSTGEKQYLGLQKGFSIGKFPIKTFPENQIPEPIQNTEHSFPEQL